MTSHQRTELLERPRLQALALVEYYKHDAFSPSEFLLLVTLTLHLPQPPRHGFNRKTRGAGRF